MIRIFYHIIQNFDEYNEDILFALISSNLHARIQRYRFKEDRVRSLIGKRLLDIALGDICGKDLKFSKYGKPYLENAQNFSITHSGNIVAIAISKNIVGLDIELLKSTNIEDFLPYFSNAEKQFIYKSIDKIEAFYHIWTKKEAILKADSTGLKDNMSEIDSINQNKYTLSKIYLSDKYICHLAACDNKVELMKIDLSMLLSLNPQNLP